MTENTAVMPTIQARLSSRSCRSGSHFATVARWMAQRGSFSKAMNFQAASG